jgi:hypothetical protein
VEDEASATAGRKTIDARHHANENPGLQSMTQDVPNQNRNDCPRASIEIPIEGGLTVWMRETGDVGQLSTESPKQP